MREIFLSFLSLPFFPITLIFSFLAMVSAVFILSKKCRDWAIKVTAIFLISVIALIANNVFVYIASLFIIATLFTTRDYLLTLIAIMRGDPRWFDYQKLVQSNIEFPKSEKARERTSMEFKILNTLWTKQVNYYPNYSKLWGFRVNAGAPEYLDFREAANRLIGEGLINESDQGQYFLTRNGIKFCAKNYTTFPNPEDQYWPDEKIKEENINTARKEAEKL